MPTSSPCTTIARPNTSPKHAAVADIELATWLQRAREEERATLARELHDELGAILTAARLDVTWLASHPIAQVPEVLQRMSALQHLLEQGVLLKRRLVNQLHPTMLEHLGLAAATEQLVTEHRTRFTGIMQVRIDPQATITGPAALALYRILQEALTNVQKYARAQTLKIRLRRLTDRITLSVHDDGCGFDPHRVGIGHHGLAGMRQRMLSVRGRLSIASAPGAGTLIQASIPLRSQQSSGTAHGLKRHRTLALQVSAA